MRPSFDRKLFALAATLFGGIATVGCGGAGHSKDAGSDGSASHPDGPGAKDGRGDGNATIDVATADRPKDVPGDMTNADGGCATDAQKYCIQGTVLGDIVRCADYITAATCVDGQWTCGIGEVDPALCTCSGIAMPACTCTKNGLVCPDAGVDADAPPSVDGSVCELATTYTFFDDGGLRELYDTIVLSPPRSETIKRQSGNVETGTCTLDLACASASGLGAIEAAIANPDVQAALAKPAGMLYGTDTRPLDGSVFVFQRSDGKGFMVGTGAGVPAGLSALEGTLDASYAQALASPTCAGLALPTE